MVILVITHSRYNDDKQLELFRKNVTGNYAFVVCKTSLGVLIPMDSNVIYRYGEMFTIG